MLDYYCISVSSKGIMSTRKEEPGLERRRVNLLRYKMRCLFETKAKRTTQYLKIDSAPLLKKRMRDCTHMYTTTRMCSSGAVLQITTHALPGC